MKNGDAESSAPPDDRRRARRARLVVAGCAFLALILFVSRRQFDEAKPDNLSAVRSEQSAFTDSRDAKPAQARPQPAVSAATLTPTAEEIVAEKVLQFTKSRRKLAYAMADHFGIPVQEEMERFFDAAESGNYEEMEAIYKSMRTQRESGSGVTDYGPQWRTVIETEGAATEAHNWPAQKLLEYGNAVLDSLRPGMIYAGGTDPGCFIPTLLNETSEGDRRVTLTQNALADSSYLDYLNFLYGDKMATVTKEDSQRMFGEYVADARKRLDHDEKFPNEPKQIRPGEDVRRTGKGDVEVSGQGAVMAINEKLFQVLMDKNPDVSFAMEESFPFKSMFGAAAPLGPIMELRVRDAQPGLTSEAAAQAAEYWSTTAKLLVSDPESPAGSDPRLAYAKLAASQAGLLFDRGYASEAEQAYRSATEMAPTSPEAVFRYVDLLVQQNRLEAALPVAENALRFEPYNQKFQDLLGQLKRLERK